MAEKDKLPVQVVATPECGFLRSGRSTEWQCMFEVVTDKMVEEAGTERPPIQLAVVLDRSGSMNGSKLHFAKMAVNKVIKHLVPGKDTLHVVVYGSKVQTIVENNNLKDKDDLRADIEEITTEGCTNLSGGLQRGFELLKEHSAGAGSISRIFMFSDGIANRGETNKAKVAAMAADMVKQGVSVSAFGIGSDHDQEMMQEMAKHGGGHYMFLDNARKIQKGISKAIHGLEDLLGTDAVLKITSGTNTNILKVWGREDPAGAIRLGDLLAEDVVRILVECETKCSKDLITDMLALTWKLVYNKPNPEGKPIEKTATGLVELQVTDDRKKTTVKDDKVLISRAVQQCAENNKKVADLINENNLDAAKELQQSSIDLLESVKDKDKDGKIERLLKNSIEQMKQLQNKTKLKKLSKNIKFDATKLCADTDWGYMSGSDSDEEMLDKSALFGADDDWM